MAMKYGSATRNARWLRLHQLRAKPSTAGACLVGAGLFHFAIQARCRRFRSARHRQPSVAAAVRASFDRDRSRLTDHYLALYATL